MATTQIDPADSPSVLADGVIADALSWLADEFGIGWGLVLPLVLPLVALLVVGLVLTVLLWRRYGRSPSRSTGADVFPGHTATLRSSHPRAEWE